MRSLPVRRLIVVAAVLCIVGFSDNYKGKKVKNVKNVSNNKGKIEGTKMIRDC